MGQTLEGMMRGDFTADLTPLREGDVGVLAGQLELACKRMNHLVAQLSGKKPPSRILWPTFPTS